MSSPDAGRPISPVATAPVFAAIFAAMGDPTRLSLLTRLSDGEPRSIASLSQGAAITRQAVTKHLQALEGAGLVSSRRIGREARFSYRPETLDQARLYLDRVSAQWDEALARLRALVEDDGQAKT